MTLVRTSGLRANFLRFPTRLPLPSCPASRTRRGSPSLPELKTRDVFFLDSLTNPKSVAYATAREFGLKAAKRDVFLDNEENNPEYIRGQLEELARIAKKRGRAIGVGHPP